jgi:hypothetical protein
MHDESHWGHPMRGAARSNVGELPVRGGRTSHETEDLRLPAGSLILLSAVGACSSAHTSGAGARRDASACGAAGGCRAGSEPDTDCIGKTGTSARTSGARARRDASACSAAGGCRASSPELDNDPRKTNTSAESDFDASPNHDPKCWPSGI